MGKLEGKTILVTGATSGIGEAAIIHFLSHGANIVALGRNELKLKNLKDLSPFRVSTLSVDLLNESGFILAEPITSIFHAAGYELLMPAFQVTQPDFENLVWVSVGSIYTLLQHCSAKVNSVVIMSSVAGIRGSSGMSAYSAAKGAIDAMTRSLAVEYAPRIRFNSIVAGAVETPMHERIKSKIGTMAMENHKKEHLLGFGKPIDIAKAAAFLLSDEARWITGTNMVVDGGYSCH